MGVSVPAAGLFDEPTPSSGDKVACSIRALVPEAFHDSLNVS